MINVGLTGSIAVGKSFVCNEFKKLGCYVLDADLIAREVVEPGTKGLNLIVKAFGSDVLQADGKLDRQKLGSIIFSDTSKRNLLNSIVHPLVIEKQDDWISKVMKKDREAIAVVDAALMIESGGYRRFDKLVVVWCDPEKQKIRLMNRDGLGESDALKRIAAQMSQEEKKTYADYLIDTSDGYEHTVEQVLEIHKMLKSAR